MKNNDTIKKELLEIRAKLKKTPPEVESKIEIEFLRARALDLVEQVLSGKHVSEKIKRKGGELNKEDLIELIDIARHAAYEQSVNQILHGPEQQSISDIVSTAFWQGRAVKIFLLIFIVLFSICISIATFGTITIFDRASKASEILVEANNNLREAKDTLDIADSIKRQISQRIEDFDGQFSKLDNSIDDLENDLDAAKQDQVKQIDKYSREIQRVIADFRSQTNSNTSSINSEYNDALAQMRDKPNKLDDQIREQTKILSEKVKTFETDYYNPLVSKYSFLS